MLIAPVAFAAVGLLWGYFAGFYTASVTLAVGGPLISSPALGNRDSVGRDGPQDWVAALARSDLVVLRVARELGLADAGDAVASLSEVSSLPAPGLISIRARGRSPTQVVRLANVYGEQAVAAAQELAEVRGSETRRQIQQKLIAVDEELAQASRQWAEFQRRTTGTDFDGESAAPVRLLTELDRKAEGTRGHLAACDLQIQSLGREIAKLTPALVTAREALAQALMRYTEEHPKVKELQAAVESLEAQIVARGAVDDPGIAAWNSPAAVGLYTRVIELKSQKATLINDLEALILQRQQVQAQVKSMPDDQAEHVRLKSQFEALKDQRFVLARRLQETQLTQGTGVLGVRIIEPASRETLSWSDKLKTGVRFGCVSAIMGLFAAALLAIVLPDARRRIRSEGELAEVTQLPVLGTLGDLARMTPLERERWAFRAFTAIRGRLTGTNRDALICGITSATHGEGRSTWINLLAEAADKQGFQVVTISAAHPPNEIEPGAVPDVPVSLSTGAEPARLLPDIGRLAPPQPLQRRDAALPVASAWNADHRNQWQQALQQWQSRERLIVFVELPPASMPEAVLLAEGLPNLIWLCCKGTVRTSETRQHLGTLRLARSNLVGCVLNRTARAAGMVLAGLLASSVLSQETTPAVPQPVPTAAGAVNLTNAAALTNASRSLSVASPDQLAQWQQRLTFGPGDVFDVSLYEQADSARPSVTVGPDGRINYLEARDVVAAGLTVDELRARLEGILSKFRRAPRVIIIPTAYNSKKYYMLGNVNGKGVYSLDRPVSLLEAIAKAKGFVTTPPALVTATPGSSPVTPQQTLWIQADFSRSLLIRRRTDGSYGRVVVDFEGLFVQADLGHNIPLEPDDYLFFPPLEQQEVYVLGEVGLPGVMPYSPTLTALGSIASRGGFTERAYKGKVLIVRGSFNRPETFVLNVADIWKAKGLDLPLQNRDIVYVHTKPWAWAQELVEAAAISFVQAVAMGGANNIIFPASPVPTQ
jgi:protein involved in polysaccharide export with SLBB domain/capsular polysaccharide biosynthesis protein